MLNSIAQIFLLGRKVRYKNLDSPTGNRSSIFHSTLIGKLNHIERVNPWP
jgi:hypothetical protein